VIADVINCAIAGINRSCCGPRGRPQRFRGRHEHRYDAKWYYPTSDGPSWIDLAEIRVNTTESRFAAYLNRLLQQNLPLPDSCTAASGALFDQLVGAAKQRQRGQSKLAHRSPRFEFALVNLSQTVKYCLSDSDRGPAPSTKRVTDVTQ